MSGGKHRAGEPVTEPMPVVEMKPVHVITEVEPPPDPALEWESRSWFWPFMWGVLVAASIELVVLGYLILTGDTSCL